MCLGGIAFHFIESPWIVIRKVFQIILTLVLLEGVILVDTLFGKVRQCNFSINFQYNNIIAYLIPTIRRGGYCNNFCNVFLVNVAQIKHCPSICSSNTFKLNLGYYITLFTTTLMLLNILRTLVFFLREDQGVALISTTSTKNVALVPKFQQWPIF